MTDFLPMLIEFGENLTLLIALTFLYSFIIQKLSEISDTTRSTIQGILFGVMAIIGMQIPMHVADGIIVDGRTVIVMLASPFAGNIAGLIAGAIVSLFRLYLGGVGTTAGIGAILSAMVVGMAFNQFFNDSPGKIKVKHLLAMVAAMTLISLAWVFALPPSVNSLAIFNRLIIPVSIMYPVATILLGVALAHEYRRLELIEDVRRSQIRYKGLFDNAGVSIWNEDLTGIWDKFKQLREQGVVDLRQYLIDNEDLLDELAGHVKVLAVNKATLKLFGAASQYDILNRIDSTYGDNAKEIFTEEVCAIWDGHKMFSAEAAFKSLDNKNLSAFITFQIPSTREGFKNVPVSLVDVTERRELEEKIRHSQKMEAVGQLTGGISHDFNNILGIIQGNLELLTDIVKGNDKALKRIETAQSSVSRGAEMTRKLLGFSRKDAKQLQVTSMNMFIENLESLIAKSLTASIKVETRLADDLWQVTTDPGELENAVLNLSLNARDAMPEGGTLVIETANKVLDEKYAAINPGASAGNFVMVSVTDTGIGMTEETKDKILEPFFTTKGMGKGTGLGLSMIYGFVQRSGGHMKIYSEFGKGTTIRLYLPCSVEATGTTDTDLESTEPLPKGKETILIVDDENELLEIAASYLKELGYKTITAANGQQALDVLDHTDKVDLLFSDVIMSGKLDGYQLAQEAHKHKPALKVLLTSGFSQGVDTLTPVNQNIPLHANDTVLEKPYNMSELAVALRRMLDKTG